jgi:endonuclease/exonuclease/phosphatase family metal-dependent hydrolase
MLIEVRPRGSLTHRCLCFPRQGAVLVHLERLSDGAPLTVISTHLSSGTKDADRQARVHECTAPSVDANGELKAPSLREWFSSQTTPTLLCIDMNEGPAHKSEAGDGGEEAANRPWSLLHDGADVRSVWDSYYNLDGSSKSRGAGRTLVTTNKMRGPLSDQPTKVGEHAFEAIDHIFYRNGSQEEAAAAEPWQLSMLQHAWGPLEYASPDAALQTILPSLEVPSDHSPVIVDMLLLKKPLGGAAATPAPEQRRAAPGVPARLRHEVMLKMQRAHEQLLRIEAKSLSNQLTS